MERFGEIESNIDNLIENGSNETYEIIIINDDCAKLEFFNSFPNVYLISFNISVGRGFSILIGHNNANVFIKMPSYFIQTIVFFLIGKQEVVR